MKTMTNDGRIVLTGQDYQKLREKKCKAADNECEWCAMPARLNIGHLHHLHGRGGGKRDDTVASTVWLCSNCHELEHRPETIH